ncbi:MAG: tetratricopeptide repeat protein [Bacteroidaceae bacterium]|nr:tetratricopeptide repeat protein [Bacteroidaceae bacterium]
MKKQILLLAAVLVLVLTACKPPKEFIDKVKMNPDPAVYKAGKVEVTFEGNFPEKYFTKKMTMTVTPVLTTSDGRVYKGTPKKYQGQKVKDNNDVIKYKVGGKYTQSAIFEFEEGMETATITLEATVETKKKTYELEPVVIGKGINITPTLVSLTPGTGDLSALVIADKFQRIIEERTNAQIKYLINQSQIRSSELKQEEVKALTNTIKNLKNDSTRQIKGIEVSSYASPDGGMDLNEKLAGNRGKSSENYINGQLRKIKAQVSIESDITAEDWEGFQALVNASNIEDKAVILRILSMYTDPEEREAEIKKLSALYKVLADEILPELRRSKMSLVVNVVGKSDEEIARLAKEDATKLNEEELLYAATLTNDMAEKQAIYAKATEQFPNSVRAFNNLGYAYYEQGKYAEAQRCFEKAISMDANNTAINFNMGLVMLVNNNIDKAEEYFGKSAGVGKSLNQAQGVIAILKGNYKKAAQLFGNDATNNAALAHILNNDNAAARRALDNNQNPNATTYYLRAILAARTNNKAEYDSNLAQASRLDAKYATRGAEDVEFNNVR